MKATNKILMCVGPGCKNIQGEDGEYCEKCFKILRSKYKEKKNDNAYGIGQDIGVRFCGFIYAESPDKAVKKIRAISNFAESKGVFLVLKNKNGIDILL